MSIENVQIESQLTSLDMVSTPYPFQKISNQNNDHFKMYGSKQVSLHEYWILRNQYTLTL